MALIEAPPVDMILFFQKVRKAQQAWAQELSIPLSDEQKKQVLSLLSKKEHVWSHELFPFDPTKLRIYGEEILELLQSMLDRDGTSTENQETLFSLGQLLQGDGADEFYRLLAEGDFEALEKKGSALSIDQPLLHYLIRAMLKPYLLASAKALGDIFSTQEWNEPICPHCGSEPSMGRLSTEEHGKRYLFCSTCETEWPFRRVVCPFCANEDQYTLPIYYVEEERHYRIEGCDQCKRYLKTVDERHYPKKESLDLYEEDVATVQLDLVAREKGLTQK
ncbi:formate dehydrogenase accessory protein FdhE [Heliorestis acidaminivorans]|uniref:Formate dehydrogenase accessory protein FdhE n=1 Tax=Heliorestis acidaminivorans TaxID=553427 RepID=A0A6I0EY85_9FIRM|nr:formate dehydrogenase accessory protein FdhE [Heliorestis acidaminivorans]KAB2953381.1 formate dehydrogenase accessory protein FdhE [Heliorestis acidaminivorans]